MNAVTTGGRDGVRFRRTTVAEAMRGGVIHCAPETPIRRVAALMAEHSVHAVYVFDYGFEDDETVELWGLVYDLDVAAATLGDIDALTARHSAVRPLVTIRADEPLVRAAELMARHGTAHLAVLSPDTGRPVGVVSTLDVARIAAS